MYFVSSLWGNYLLFIQNYAHLDWCKRIKALQNDAVFKEEWVSDYCLSPNEQFFSYIMARTSYNFSAISWREQVTIWWDDDDNVHFVLDEHTELDFYSVSSLKQ
jgi:uncharacterized protein YcaQ